MHYCSNGMPFTFLTCAQRQTCALLCPQKVGGMATLFTYSLSYSQALHGTELQDLNWVHEMHGQLHSI